MVYNGICILLRFIWFRRNTWNLKWCVEVRLIFFCIRRLWYGWTEWTKTKYAWCRACNNIVETTMPITECVVIESDRNGTGRKKKKKKTKWKITLSLLLYFTWKCRALIKLKDIISKLEVNRRTKHQAYRVGWALTMPHIRVRYLRVVVEQLAGETLNKLQWIWLLTIRWVLIFIPNRNGLLYDQTILHIFNAIAKNVVSTAQHRSWRHTRAALPLHWLRMCLAHISGWDIHRSNNNTYFRGYSLVVGTLSFRFDNILAAAQGIHTSSQTHTNLLRHKTIIWSVYMYWVCVLWVCTYVSAIFLHAMVLCMFIFVSLGPAFIWFWYQITAERDQRNWLT